MSITELYKKVIAGHSITKAEALWLYDQPLEELTKLANKIREHFCKDKFDMCTIINAKSGQCSENCRFCSQSAHSKTASAIYPLLDEEEILKLAKYNEEEGVYRFSLVTAGRRLSKEDIAELCPIITRLCKETNLSICVSLGLLDEEDFRKLRQAGATRVHNNLETSQRNFPNICTTHSFQDKINSILAAQGAGLEVCSGGIMGLGETVADRIDMAFSLKELDIKSIPINMLNPIPGTPFADNPLLTQEDICRIAAVYRFILPQATIRLAGGRGLLEDKGKKAFLSGDNGAISGDMLTTSGSTIKNDYAILTEIGYKVEKPHV